MARGRMLNKKIGASKQIDGLPGDTCRLLATWLIAHLDKRGVFYADPDLVRSFVFPRRGDVGTDDIEEYLQAMAAAVDGDGVPLIILFESHGDRWQFWPGFLGNQVGMRPERESTHFPAPPGWHDFDDETADDDEAPDDAPDGDDAPDDGAGPPPEDDDAPDGDDEADSDADAAAEVRQAARKPAKKADYLTTGQREFLNLFGAKRFRTRAAREEVLNLERQYGTRRMLEAARWAAIKQMTLGDAITAITTALPDWGKPKGKKGKGGNDSDGGWEQMSEEHAARVRAVLEQQRRSRAGAGMEAGGTAGGS